MNNRDLKTFQVDISNSVRLRELVPKEILFVSESGMKTAEDIRILEENGTNAVLIGETLMRSPIMWASSSQKAADRWNRPRRPPFGGSFEGKSARWAYL